MKSDCNNMEFNETKEIALKEKYKNLAPREVDSNTLTKAEHLK